VGIAQTHCRRTRRLTNRLLIGVPSNEPLSAVQLVKLSHSYQPGSCNSPVIDTATAQFRANRVLALLGQSGSGKSTLLNLISGLEPLQTGDIQLFGQSLKSTSDKQRTLLRRNRIGFIYQAFNLIPTLTVFENTALPLALNKVNREQQQARVLGLLEKLGLRAKLNEFPDRLSGGEQQRVAIARAIVHEPDLILADEPTGNLDAQAGRLILDTLLELVADKNSTLLLVTHSREVASHAQEIWTLQQGRLLQQDAGSAW